MILILKSLPIFIFVTGLGKEIFQRQKRLSIEKTPLNIKVYGHTQPFPLSYIGMGGGNIEITFDHHGECYTLSNISVAK